MAVRLVHAAVLSVSRSAPVLRVRRAEYRGSPVRPWWPRVWSWIRRRHCSRPCPVNLRGKWHFLCKLPARFWRRIWPDHRPQALHSNWCPEIVPFSVQRTCQINGTGSSFVKLAELCSAAQRLHVLRTNGGGVGCAVPEHRHHAPGLPHRTGRRSSTRSTSRHLHET